MTMGSPAVLSSPRKNQATSLRRTNKPLVEKKRRARINGCLGQLKSLLLSAMKTEGTQVSRLEKADILEMTVKYLRHVQCQPQMVSPSPSTLLPVEISSSSPSSLSTNTTTPTPTTEPEVTAKFSAGYTECATEVIRYMESVTGMTDDIKMRLENHLVGRLHGSVATPATSSVPVSSSSSHVENNSNQSHIKTSPEGNHRANNECIQSNDVVSPRHYQTAVDLANMASNIVQQQQNHHQQHQHHRTQIDHHQQPIQTSSQPEDTLSKPPKPVTCPSVAATPDTPPNTPPHMKMETDCYYDNVNYNNNKNTKTFEDDTTHINSSSSPSSTSLSPSSSEDDDDEMITESTGEDCHPICVDPLNTSASFRDRQTKQLHSGDGNPHTNSHPYSSHPSHRHMRNDQIKCDVMTSPINLIRRRLPLSAYSTPLHIDIPGSPALSTTPSPPHVHISKPGHHSFHTNPNNYIHKQHDCSHNGQDNESLPTILYGARQEAPRQSVAPVTHRGPHHHHQNTHPSHPKTMTKNTCNLDNSENNSRFLSQSIQSSISPETHENNTPSAHPSQKPTLQTVFQHQGHPHVRIDNHRAALSSPCPPTSTREDTGKKPTPLIKTPPPHPYLSTAQKTRHYSGDSHSNISSNGHAASSQPPYVTETRKSPASQFVIDNTKAVDMRNWKRCDRKSEITNGYSKENSNTFEDINNNGYQYICKNSNLDTNNLRQPSSAFNPIPRQNHLYQERYFYHHQHLQKKQQKQFADNLKSEQMYNGNVENVDNKNNSNTTMRMQTPSTSQQRLLNDHAQYQRFSSPLNQPQSSHPVSNHQHQNHHPNFSQNHPQRPGMRSGRELSLIANSTEGNGHFMNENRTMPTKEHEQCRNYNKTRAIASVAEAMAASRQNRSALLPLALRSETTGTGQVSEVNSYSVHPRRATPVVTRQKVESHEPRANEGIGCVAKGINPGNYHEHSESQLLTSLDSIDHGREQVWRPW